ncbi:MAG: FtsK/SpoIIIE domain-containing protein, partial [Chitinivibrionia bacterium]|nr:FtsK/SpoIIIE domain-containing protein [Chitinivibrionia bacterium]
KKVEMACYEGIPHLLMPVVTEVENAVKVLECAVKEMMYRYDLLKKVGSKNLDSFNEKVANRELDKLVSRGELDQSENKKMCYIVVIIDELADLMMTAGKEVEKYIQRIAQLARAVGIHLIVATQRPDTKVITGNIKANLPSRIAFRVMSYIDSRTIIDSKGAEQLLGNGDMLYLKNGAPKIIRYHGAFISEKDVENLVENIKNQGYKCENLPSFDIKEEPDYGDNDVSYNDGYGGRPTSDYGSGEGIAKAYSSAGRRKLGNRDEMFEEAARLIVISKLGSTSSIQRHLNLGYARAGRVMDELAAAGIVGPQEVIGKPRKVLVSENELENILESLSQESE